MGRIGYGAASSSEMKAVAREVDEVWADWAELEMAPKIRVHIFHRALNEIIFVGLKFFGILAVKYEEPRVILFYSLFLWFYFILYFLYSLFFILVTTEFPHFSHFEFLLAVFKC